MDALQLAQVLADLSSLAEAQEAAAAKNLVNSNKKHETEHVAARPPPPPSTSAPATHSEVHGMLAPPKRPAAMVRSESSEGISARTASPYASSLFHHRRMFTSPPMSRCSSATPSIPGTPRREPEVRLLEEDDEEEDKRGHAAATPNRYWASQEAVVLLRRHDMMALTGVHAVKHDEHDKAAMIMALYSLRAKLNNPDNTALNKARDKIAAIAEGQRLQEQIQHQHQHQHQQQNHQHQQHGQSAHHGQQHHPARTQNIWASRLGGEQISPRAGGSGD
jgi:hypothetical protein